MKSYFFDDLRYQLRFAWQKWSRPLAEVLIAGSIALAAGALFTTSEGRELDYWVLRHFFQFRGPRQPPSDVVMVAIDDETYQHFEVSTNFPLPRRYLADALEMIEAATPKAIILDAKIPAQPNMEADADNRIEAALRAGPTTIWTGEMPPEHADISGTEKIQPTILRSDARFRQAAKLELPMTVAGQDEMVLYVSYSTAHDATLYERVPIARALVELAKMEVPEPGPEDMINFYGPAGTFRRISLHCLLDGDSAAARESLRNKIVLLGYQSLARGRGMENKDEFAVPVSRFPMFGLEIHANIVGNLIDRSWLRQPARSTQRKFLFLVSLLMASAGIHFPTARGAAIVIATTGSIVVLDYFMFALRQTWSSGIGSILAASVLSIVAIAFYRVWRTESFRKFIRRAINFETEREL